MQEGAEKMVARGTVNHGEEGSPVLSSGKIRKEEKERLDRLAVASGLAPTRERAQALILAGRVLVDGQKLDKPGTKILASSELRLLGDDLPYVSRGGLKLEAALRHWSVALTGRSCMDVGASTGGFTDCMLQRGASAVLAVDTGWGQIAMKLRQDERVTLMERTNARLLEPRTLSPEISFVAMDVAFISATLVLPAVCAAAPGLREMVILVKPQFEAGREFVGKGGIVRDEEGWLIAIKRVRSCVEFLGGQQIEVIDSPITGTGGNHEYLLHATLPARDGRETDLIPYTES